MLSAVVVLKLLLTAFRYQMFKVNREENIPAYLTNLIILNLLLAGVFVKGNLMYFSVNNLCGYVEEGLTRVSYKIFCVLLILGYFQFIYCILLSFYIPLIGYIIYQLVQHRLG